MLCSWCLVLLLAFRDGPAVGATLRLVNGVDSCSGRVEVLYNGLWGTVCDDIWDLSHAAVVCKEVGCGPAIEAKSVAFFGEGSGPIWLDDVSCVGTEASLINCGNQGWGIHNCLHEEDAGVICQEFVRRNVVRIVVKSQTDTDINDTSLKRNLLDKIRAAVGEKGDYAVNWREQPDGKVFYPRRTATGRF